MTGITKSGRVVKKSAKMMEMEQMDDLDYLNIFTKRKKSSKNKVTEKISSDASLNADIVPENITNDLFLSSNNIKHDNNAITSNSIKADFFGENTYDHDKLLDCQNKTLSENEAYNQRKVPKQRDKKSDVRKISAAFLEWSKSQTRNMIKEHHDCDMSLFKNYLSGFWRCISAKEKMRWHRKAQRGGEIFETEDNFLQLNLKTLLDPIDIAALLSLIGDSLVNVGTRLQEHKGMIALEGNLSLLLNSLLSSLSLLMILTNSFPVLHSSSQDLHLDTIEKIKGFFESG